MDAFYQPSYGYDIELDSDDDAIRIDGQESSDEEDQFEGDVSIRKFLREYEQRATTGSRDTASRESEDEDDLEKELDAELELTVAEIEKRRFQTERTNSGPSTTTALSAIASPDDSAVTEASNTERSGEKREETTTGGAASHEDGAKPGGGSDEQFYDEEYYDSDDDDEGESGARKGGQKKKKKQNPVISNDDLLYDPDADDDDQKWMDEQRAKQRAKTKSKTPNSDAMLDCPACLTTVCIDCQRHEIYDNQFRAMFVQHCIVDPAQTIAAPLQDNRKRRHGRTPAAAPSDGGAESPFASVKCAECQTVVGAMDEEEIYYFFNVVPSHT